MTHSYVDAESQTDIAGLTRNNSHRPAVLYERDATPPLTRTEDMPAATLLQPGTAATNPSKLLLRRGQAGTLIGQIPLPGQAGGDDDETTRSPPPSHAALSPLPPANLLHAGHTPIDHRSFSPKLQDSPQQQQHNELLVQPGDHTPDCDPALSGALSLPALPGDGSDDHIELRALDAELEKIAKAQSEPHSPSSEACDDAVEVHGEDKTEAAPRRQSATAEAAELVDGVLLKKPRLNMGAPLGQA